MLVSSLVILSGEGCTLFSGPRHHEEIRSPETSVAKTPLPQPPAGSVHRLEFDDPADGSRMSLRNRSDIAQPSVVHETKVPTAADLEEHALANTQVRHLLGPRYSLITIGILNAGHSKAGCCKPSPSRVRLTYYSYSHNHAVEVDMTDGTVSGLRRRDGYLPMEGEEEVKEAIALARKDSRIAEMLPDLEGHAILMQPGDGLMWNDAGFGHRVFWVTFSRGLTGKPEEWAVVDLNEQKVLKAGGEETHP